ncbi:SapC family protein [Brevundimonas sp. CEF1]|uniref:SapC family protein n=1 Tax=Brevundimonas sp. CEF1 TaxID=3442642 RepID=UPI003F50DA0A
MSEASALPLFYRDPQPLSAAEHGDWRLKDGDVAFAADTPFVPVVVSEIAAAARSYPVVFSAGEGAQPVAVLGLEQRNLFVAGGRWTDEAYVPAYVRRYPFGFIATVNPDGFALAIDAASDRVLRAGEEGAALFEAEQPTKLTQDAMAFCNVFQGEADGTRAFGEALREQNLLIDRRADATLPDGRKLGLDGFQVIDTERFANLDEAVVLDWHRRGWLALVHFHLASLERFGALLTLQAQATPPAEPADKPAKSKKA